MILQEENEKSREKVRISFKLPNKKSSSYESCCFFACINKSRLELVKRIFIGNRFDDCSGFIKRTFGIF